MIRNRFKFWLSGGCVKAVFVCIYRFKWFCRKCQKTESKFWPDFLEATFTFTLITQCPVKKWHFDKSESKSLRKQSWPNLMFLKIRDAISQQKCIFLNILLGLVSKHESEDRNSRSRLGAWDRREEILDLVSKHEIVRKNSHSRLEARDRETEILDLV